MLEDLIAAWRIANEKNLRLLDAIPAEHLADRASPRGRTVGEQFVHVVNVRIKWIQVRMGRDAKDLQAFPKEKAGRKKALRQAFVDTAARMEDFFRRFRDGVKAKSSTPQSILRFYSYMVAHEAHHRGQALLHLKLCGHAPPQDVRFGIWNW